MGLGSFVHWMVELTLHPRSQGLFVERRVAVKMLLIMYNAPGHPQSISIKIENIPVVFLPPNTTSLFHPLDQDIIRCVKASYTR
jgi:hypothetical protein